MAFCPREDWPLRLGSCSFCAGLVAALVVLALWSTESRFSTTDISRSVTSLLGQPPTPADDYTFVPRDLSPEEFHRWYPKNLRVEALQVLHRHGERTPTEDHFPGSSVSRDGWPLCWTPDTTEDFSLRIGRRSPYRVGTLDQEGRVVNHTEGECAYGQLTDKGKRTLFRLGVYLRQLYIHRLRFLPDKWTREAEIFIRTTDVTRTQHSVVSLLMGLYPNSHRAALLPVPTLYHVPSAKEYLYLNPEDCPREKELLITADASDLTLKARIDEVCATFPEVKPWLDSYTQAETDVWDSHAISGVDDTFVSLAAHGRPLPRGITPAAMRAIRDVASQDGYRVFQVSEPFTRLLSGRFLAELVERFDAAARGAPRPRLALYSAHDTTLAPILAALGIFDGRSPLFGAAITVELLVGASNPHVRQFRVWHDARPMALPFCPQSIPAPHTCPWPVARQYLSQWALTHAEYEVECRPRNHSPSPRAAETLAPH